jgi:hypothetical protein
LRSLALRTAPTGRGLVDALHTTRPIDGFRLVYERAGSGAPVVLLHGWPGDRRDYRYVLPLLTPVADLIVPDLRGFGASDSHAEPVVDAYSAEAQARNASSGTRHSTSSNSPANCSMGNPATSATICATSGRTGRDPASSYQRRTSSD